MTVSMLNQSPLERRIESRIRRIEQTLKQSLGQPIAEQPAKKLIRDKALEVYRIGAEQACNFFDVENFWSAEDFADIGRITDDTYRIYAYGKQLDSALITLTSVTLAKALVRKARQIVSLYPPHLHLGAAMRMKSVTENLDIPPEDATPLIEDYSRTGPLPGLYFVWRTMGDDRVCEICDALDGQEWDFETDEPLTPVADTHPRCRCRIDLERRTPY